MYPFVAGRVKTRLSRTSAHWPRCSSLRARGPRRPALERYLFVAIDRATRWVSIHLYRDQREASAKDFLRRLVRAVAMSIGKILTDNGSQFTDRFTAKDQQPTGQHVFDKTCAEFVIEHRLAAPRRPRTNRMVERFNGRVGEVIQQSRFASAHGLEATLTR